MIDEDDCGAIGGMKIDRGNRSTRRKPIIYIYYYILHTLQYYYYILNLSTARRYYFPRRAVRLMRGNMFMICQQCAADISFISRLLSVTNSEQRVSSR
jgi:hypothetical protein